MYLHFEENISSRTDSTIHSLTWMGKVPDSVPGERSGGWKLNKGQYYSEGWLASGNAKGIVGVTFTASHCRKYDPPNRSNFNLRGHRSEVVLVRWNEPYQKLATCDAQGIIFVWIKHEGRWSIELINDRNSQVTDFAWSHDGRMALICYCDGFVLVGSVAGQRYWSSMLNLDSTVITCGVWSPDDQQVMFGTSDGQIIVMSSTGAMVSQVMVLEGMEICSLLWSCEKFNLHENPASTEPSLTVTTESEDAGNGVLEEKIHTLAVCFKHGAIYFMSGYDDVCPRVVHSMLTGLKMDWSNCGGYLAVGGFHRLPNLLCENELHFYTPSGNLVHIISVPSQGKPLTAVCWSHNDRRLCVAAGQSVHVAWVVKHVPSLQYLSQHTLHGLLRHEQHAHRLPLPTKLCSAVRAFFTPTIKSYIPDPFKLRGFVSTPPPGCERLFCTMIHHGEEMHGGHYTLYLEYLGGLIPLLKGKRASKLRPDFIIFDPKIKAKKNEDDGSGAVHCEVWSESSSSDSDVEPDRCGGSPRGPRRTKRPQHFRADRVERSTTFRTLNELFYNDNLPESSKLVEVLSNIWGTKFRLLGTAAQLPEDLGTVVYKTSLLHLQPRQMTVTVTELPREHLHLAQDHNFTPAQPADDGMDDLSVDGLLSGVHNEHYLQQLVAEASEDIEVLSVDTATNQLEISELSTSDTTSLVHAQPERQKPACMTTMTTKLSPASETHPHNNQAFTMAETTVITNSSGHAGARPKLPHHTTYTNAHMEPEASSTGLSMNTSLVNGSVKCPRVETAQRGSISSQCDTSAISQVPISQFLQKQNSAIVGDYFFANGDCSRNAYNEPSGSKRDECATKVSGSKSVPNDKCRTPGSESSESGLRWADPACQGIRYSDESPVLAPEPREANIVFDSSQAVTPTSDNQKRFYLEPETKSSDNSDSEKSASSSTELLNNKQNETGSSIRRHSKLLNGDKQTHHLNPLAQAELNTCDGLEELTNPCMGTNYGHDPVCVFTPRRKSSMLSEFERDDIMQTSSVPNSPLHKADSPSRRLWEEVVKGRTKHLSPLFPRKAKYRSMHSGEEPVIHTHYDNLESFQKAQMKHKLQRRSEQGVQMRQQFVLHNKAPLWNENSQVYQLDFGGRVTQESAKNFQVEHKGKQVMQFGRIDSNAYTLDFQYPFTAIQAFAVALANVTQRLK